MGNRIPDETIESIQSSVDIVEVINEYVQLKKQGRNYFGLCPFHGESTPSFSVSPEKQIYHCFGCGEGGNVFSFLMNLEGLSFIDSIYKLGEKAGIDLPDPAGSQQASPEKNKDVHTMIEAHELLKKFYHHLLINTKEGQEALDYLLQRGFTKETIEKFEIGYSLDSWDFVVKFLTKRGFDAELMEKAGLLVRKQSDQSFLDRFRNRIMFPIHDHHGNTVAFSGRVLNKNEQPKYLNSPETKIFNKSKLLYNFNQARLHIRKQEQAILFEGFADVISAAASGVEHSIATMGTSLTDEQAKILKRNVSDIIICYDSDSAGADATIRASRTLTSIGCKVRVAVISDGMDPDDYIRKHGPEKFRNDVIGASVTLTAFKMQYYRRGKNLQNEGERVEYIEKVLHEISSLKSPVEQEIYLKQLSSEFSLPIEVLKEQIHRSSGRKDPNARPNSQQTSPAAQKPAQFKARQKRLLPAFHNAERLLIAHMLKNEDFAFKVLDRVGLQFNIEEHRAIVTYLYAYYEEGNEANAGKFLARVQDRKLHQHLTELAMMQVQDEISEQELSDYVKQVLNHQNWLKIKEKEAEKNDAERAKDYVKAAQVAMEIVGLKRALK
ncbi:DNA primase [Bacillus lacus]|uniref:DNA primase n=1 Tax=Metabacillus lacus TaxID=1983721 RepID=A0A7X2IX55_9BACI|nr:DNA primase [Metabacillus lacus]MRX71294.1 DNA primase [Metabacillus lacus]